MKILVPIIISFFCLTSSSLNAKPADELVKTYGQLFSTIEHLQVNFTQTVYTKLRNRKHSRSGQAYFSKPAKFRWNFEDPRTGLEEFYFDGKTLTHFKEQDKLVTHYRANIGLARELREVVNLILDPKALFERYQVVSSEKENRLTHIKLSPRTALATDIQELKVTVSDQSRYVQTVRILYMDENYTEFAFENPVEKVNSPSLFRFSRKGKFTVRSHG